METPHRRTAIHETTGLGEKLADAIASGMGSWRFIIGQSIVVIIWILVNLAVVAFRWDPYPFILLNLLFSTQAAYASPLILMSQNRQSQKDRLRDDLEAKEVDGLYSINQQQYEILQLLRFLAESQHTAQAFGWRLTVGRAPQAPQPLPDGKA